MRKKNAKLICKNCSKEFMAFQSDVNRGKGIFCSNSCTTSYRNKQNKKNPEEIFFQNIVKTADGCWEYQSVDKNGYGRITISKGKTIKAHRFSFEIHNNCTASGNYICHKCDNKKCVNPEHLYAGTAKDNAKDREERSIINRKMGQTHYKTKFTNEDIKQIRADLENGVMGKDLAKKYNVSKFCISAIKLRKTWKNIEAI